MKKIYLFLLFLLIVQFSTAQNTMYFMEHMPQKQSFNPAFKPKVDLYIYWPGMNGVSFNAYNSGFNYNEMKNFMDNVENPNYNPDAFIRSAGKINRFKSEARINLFGIGFKINETDFFSFNIAMNHSLILDAEPEIAYLLTNYDDIDESDFPIIVDNVYLSSNNYMNIGFTYTRKINENLTIGINPNINHNLAGIKTKNLKYIVEIESEDEFGYKDYNETFEGEAVIGLPVPVNPDAISNGELDLDEGILSDDDLKVSDFFKNKNFSLNLGATYQLKPWTFSASLLNIGTSNWKRNAYQLYGNEDVIRIYDRKIKIGIPPKIYLGAARQFTPRWNYGLMFENTFYPGKSLAAATLSLNGAVGKMLSTSVSYTAGYKFNNIGLGFRVRYFPGMDLFFVTDNFIQAINYRKTNRVSGSAGINFSLGIKNHLKPTRKQNLELLDM